MTIYQAIGTLARELQEATCTIARDSDGFYCEDHDEDAPHGVCEYTLSRATRLINLVAPHLEAVTRAQIVEEIRSEALNDLASNVLSKSLRDLEQRQEIYYDLSTRIVEGTL